MLERINKLKEKIPEYEDGKKVDAAIIFSKINRLYFSGFKSSEGIIFFTKDENYLLVDSRYYNAAIEQVKNMKIILAKDFKKELLKLIKKHEIKNILLEISKISLLEALDLEKFINNAGAFFIKTTTLDNIIYFMRSLKTEKEISKIKVAQELSEIAFNKVLHMIKSGKTEKEIAFDLEFFMKKEGADAIAFDLIVASGRNSSVPHAEPSNKKIEPGDFITIDMGATYNGYQSDMTRTIAFGKVSKKQRFVYDTVLKAQEKAIKAIKAGALCREIDNVARHFIYENGYENCFGHALGHGVGLEIHEKPFLSKNSEDILKNNMVITVEPGIYLKNEFGVRIEDMLVVKEDGCENLTNITKELIVL